MVRRPVALFTGRMPARSRLTADIVAGIIDQFGYDLVLLLTRPQLYSVCPPCIVHRDEQPKPVGRHPPISHQKMKQQVLRCVSYARRLYFVAVWAAVVPIGA